MSSVAEEKESLENFQKQCEGDVKSLRNLTLDVINSIKGLRIYSYTFNRIYSQLIRPISSLQWTILVLFYVLFVQWSIILSVHF